MKRKNILILGAALLMTAPAMSATPDDNNDGARQTVTVNEETVNGTVSEIRIDGNNAILLFTDGTTLTADMRLVTITMSYDEATSLNEELRMKNEEFAPAAEWYTINGVKLSAKPTQKGVYIVNGKKVVK